MTQGQFISRFYELFPDITEDDSDIIPELIYDRASYGFKRWPKEEELYYLVALPYKSDIEPRIENRIIRITNDWKVTRFEDNL